jgi:hypothetical protein
MLVSEKVIMTSNCDGVVVNNNVKRYGLYSFLLNHVTRTKK